jgi:hypothetical protein
MGRFRIVLCSALVAFGVACGGSTSPLQRRYDVTFHADSSQSFSSYPATPSCTPADMYCTVWGLTSVDFAGVVDVSAATVTVGTDTTVWSGSDVHLDSLPNSFTNSRVCGGVQLRATVSGGVLHGTWVQSIGCHPVARAGTFVSH